MAANPTLRLLLRLALVVSLLSLVSCATVPSAGIGRGEKLPEDGGLVAVQVITNSERLSDALPNWSEVIVVDLDRSKPDGTRLIYSLPALNNGLSSTRVFVGVLRPGRYRFAGLHGSAQVGDAVHYQSARAPQTVGSFRIETDHLTNLGTVLFQPFPGDPMAKPVVGSDTRFSYAMSRLDDDVSLGDFVAHTYPGEYARTRGQAVLGWQPDSLGPLRERLASAIRSRAVLTAAHREPASGDLYFTARLGTLYRRSEAGTWTSVHLPTEHDLIAFARLPDGSFIAGGERGGIWRARDFGGPWQGEQLKDRDQTLVWLGSIAGRLLAVASTGTGYRLYEADESTPGNWRHIGEYGAHRNYDEARRVFAVEHPPAVIADARGLTLFGSKSRHRFDAGSGHFSNEADQGVYRLVNQPNGIVVAMPHSGWSGTKPPIVSRDGGTTWESYRRLGQFHVPPYVFEDGTALGIGNANYFAVIGWRRHAALDVLASADKGATSAPVGQLVQGCDRLEGSISTDARLFARCHDGTLMMSSDRGRTWVRDVDRSPKRGDVPHEFIADPEPDAGTAS